MKKLQKSEKVPKMLGRLKRILVCGNFKFTQIENDSTSQSNYRNKIILKYVKKSAKKSVRVYSTLLARK
tara:strand:+ start:243 stop:449 length:207 start_codon:yes stop_codon:yes gene_type:complete